MLLNLSFNQIDRERDNKTYHELFNIQLFQGTTSNHYNSQAGTTLIELIISIVIISIALSGILTVMNQTVKHSADPLIQHQAIAIAESYLEEILLQAYVNPVGGYSGSDRSQFDDVNDYDGLSDVGVKDQQGNSITTLSNYTVSVTISAATLPDAISAKKVLVGVIGGDTNIKLVGYKVNI
ncbi:MAG: prepilin-type N-terminal cleavage/methylation domain-containing protein [Methylococcales bacterium]|nr:prepilin-type N-terminal cleavage/methylation domain-containing protein [Methylococcales bacterium]